MRTIFFLILLIFVFNKSNIVFALEKFSFDVEDFLTSSKNDIEFVNNNLSKKFLLTLDDDTIYITQLGGGYGNAQYIYDIKRGISHTNETILISENREQTCCEIDSLIFNKNENEGMMTLQHYNFSNVWHFKCHK